jgi:acyl carrier protein phosphodiesterase
MIGSSGGALLGEFKVRHVSGRGFTPEEVAEMALEKIVYVGASSHPVIREQAEAFKSQVREVLIRHMRQAIVSHNTTLANRFRDAGHPELVKLLEN